MKTILSLIAVCLLFLTVLFAAPADLNRQKTSVEPAATQKNTPVKTEKNGSKAAEKNNFSFQKTAVSTKNITISAKKLRNSGIYQTNQNPEPKDPFVLNFPPDPEAANITRQSWIIKEPGNYKTEQNGLNRYIKPEVVPLE